jgi:hypothetical protein
MSIKNDAKEAAKKEKTQARQTIAEKIELALGEYKNGVKKKKYEKSLKKASKLLSKMVVIPLAKQGSVKKPKAKSVASVNNSSLTHKGARS